MHPRSGFLAAEPPLAFAHRGGAAEGDENTVVAFGRAVALGYRYLETDVQTTADGVPVVFHDSSLLRLTGDAGTVAGLQWADLCTVRIGGAATVPRLDDVLGSWPGVRFNIDVKTDAAATPTVAAVRGAGAGPRVLLASFSDARLDRLRALAGPEVATSLGLREVARLRAASLVRGLLPAAPGKLETARLRAASPGGGRWPASLVHGLLPASLVRRRLPALLGGGRLPASAVAAQVPERHGRLRIVDRQFVRHAHRLGLQVHVWTVDDPAAMTRLLDLGVDGIMTDRLTVLRDVYAARGAWPPRVDG